MTAKDVYAKTYPLGGVHGNSRPLEAFQFGRDLSKKERNVIARLFNIYHFCNKITKNSELVLIGHAEFNSVEYSVSIKTIHKYIEYNEKLKHNR